MVLVAEVSHLEVHETLVEVSKPLRGDPEGTGEIKAALFGAQRSPAGPPVPADSPVHRDLLHGDGPLVFGPHVGKHVGPQPAETCRMALMMVLSSLYPPH